MKSIKLSLVVILGMGTFVYAGGDIRPMTRYEVEDQQLAEVVEYTPPPPPPQEVYVEEIYVAPPEIIPPVVTRRVAPPPVVRKTVSKPSNSGPYIGLGAVLAHYDTNCDCKSSVASGSDDTFGFIGKLGYSFNEYIALEARALKTMIDEDGGEIDSHLGLFLKPSYPIGDVSLYGLAGWAETKTSGFLRETDARGFAWGAGVDYNIAQNISLFLDYERLFQKSDSPDLDAVSLGANYKF